jgi:hypothetical protein
VESVCRVDRVSLSGCTSIQIIVTHGYEQPLVRGNLHVAN